MDGEEDSTSTAESPSSPLRHRFYRRYCISGVSFSDKDALSSVSGETSPRMVVPLETLQIGSWLYTSRNLQETDGEISGDIQLLYEQNSSDLIITTSIPGTNNALPATYCIRKVSAADLSLVTVVPNSLESMVASVVLETDETISYLPLKSKRDDGTSSGCKLKPVSLSSSDGTALDTMCFESNGSEDNEERKELGIHIVRLTASVHETGRLRDLLCFHNSHFDPNLNSLSNENLLTKKTSTMDSIAAKSRLNLIEGLPYWVSYIPWMFYSKQTRRFLQRLLFFYTLLSVLWALWQLYRHVNIIRVVIQPIIATLRYYLSSVVELFDWTFAVFTVWWHTLLSPLNVLRGLLLAPMLKLVTDFKFIFHPLYPLFVGASQLLQSSGLLTVFTSIYSVLYLLLRVTSAVLLLIMQVLLKPLYYMWTQLLNARVAVQSMDFQRMQLSWVFSLVTNSVKSIILGLAKFVGYKRKEKKIQKAIQSSASSPVVSPVCSPSSSSHHSSSSTGRHPNDSMPMIYSSPLSKQH